MKKKIVKKNKKEILFWLNPASITLIVFIVLSIIVIIIEAIEWKTWEIPLIQIFIFFIIGGIIMVFLWKRVDKTYRYRAPEGAFRIVA